MFASRLVVRIDRGRLTVADAQEKPNPESRLRFHAYRVAARGAHAVESIKGDDALFNELNTREASKQGN